MPRTVRLHPVPMLCAAALATAVVSGQARGQQMPRLELPIDCRIGKNCHVQNFVDQQPGKGAKDYVCGHLSYPGHKGTDFRVRDLAVMSRGVTVRAAAGGIVAGTRDGMSDINVRQAGRESVSGRECGNGVRIDHGDGWSTQYCHMQRGSVRVAKGERVRSGEPLGLVGMSGLTEFPHLHFEVTHRGRVVDPFVGRTRETGCGSGGAPLWNAAAAAILAYRSVGLINAGFAPSRDMVAEIAEAGKRVIALRTNAPALLFWIKTFGVRPADRQSLTLVGPDGTVLLDLTAAPVNRPKADYLTFAGKPRPKSGRWPAGTYRGVYRLTRGGKTLVKVERTVRMVPPSG